MRLLLLLLLLLHVHRLILRVEQGNVTDSGHLAVAGRVGFSHIPAASTNRTTKVML